jgi:hypothetical protein
VSPAPTGVSATRRVAAVGEHELARRAHSVRWSSSYRRRAAGATVARCRPSVASNARGARGPSPARSRGARRRPVAAQRVEPRSSNRCTRRRSPVGGGIQRGRAGAVPAARSARGWRIGALALVERRGARGAVSRRRRARQRDWHGGLRRGRGRRGRTRLASLAHVPAACHSRNRRRTRPTNRTKVIHGVP